MIPVLFLPDIRPAGYPANPKAGYPVRQDIAYPPGYLALELPVDFKI
jgi:hypothetical protein